MAAGLWQGLLELGADRKTVVVAVGGGVVGDLAGFIAATYARGLRFLQVPTSLLAQVDSSVGGKVGINLPEAKNMVGAFLQPLGVLVDTATLATLPANEYRAGLAEVVKYGVILDAEFFEYLEANTAALIERENEVLGPRDRPLLPPEGRRGRAGRAGGERAAGRAELRPHVRPRLRDAYRLRQAAARRGGGHRHGLRRAVGRSDWAASMPSSPPGSRALLQSLGLPVEVPKLDPGKVLDAMMHDKKVQHGQLRFVLPTGWATWNWWAILTPADIRAALQRQVGSHSWPNLDCDRSAASLRRTTWSIRCGCR